MQRLLDLIGKISIEDWVVAASASLLGAVLAKARDIRTGLAYFLSGLLCGLLFPSWIAHFLWKYPPELRLGVVAILAVSGYSIIMWIRARVRERLMVKKLGISDIDRRKGNDD